MFPLAKNICSEIIHEVKDLGSVLNYVLFMENSRLDNLYNDIVVGAIYAPLNTRVNY